MRRNTDPSSLEEEGEDGHRTRTIRDLQTHTHDSSVSSCTPPAQAREPAHTPEPRVDLGWDAGLDQWCDKGVVALWTVAAVVAVVVVVAVAEAAVHYCCWVVPVCNQE